MNSISRCARSLAASLAVVLLAGTLAAQSSPEQDKASLRAAAREFVLAADEATIEKHLTDSAQEVLKKAEPAQRSSLLRALMLGSPANTRGTVKWLEGDQPIVRAEGKSVPDVFEISVESVQIVDGKATVELGVKRWYQGQPAPDDWIWPRHATVQARMEGGTWRLLSITVFTPDKDTFALDGPDLEKALTSAHEASAVGSLRTLNTAQVVYETQYPEAGYACSLAELGVGQGEPFDQHHAGLIDNTLAGGSKSGYIFTLACTGKPANAYTTTAVPAQAGGGRAFCSDESAVIRYASDGKGETCLKEGKPLQ